MRAPVWESATNCFAGRGFGNSIQAGRNADNVVCGREPLRWSRLDLIEPVSASSRQPVRHAMESKQGGGTPVMKSRIHVLVFAVALALVITAPALAQVDLSFTDPQTTDQYTQLPTAGTPPPAMQEALIAWQQSVIRSLNGKDYL